MSHTAGGVIGRLSLALQPSGRAGGLDLVWVGGRSVVGLGVMTGGCGVRAWAGLVGGLAEWPETSSGGRKGMAKARHP